MFDLHDKVAVVTGAGSGIGAAIATLFARQGARCIIIDRNDSADATVQTICDAGGHADAWRCASRPPAEVVRTFTEIHERFGRIVILVNNAGIAHVDTIEQTTPEDLDRLYAVNVRGLFLCSRPAVGIMLPQGGADRENMASITSLVGVPERFAYSMTKGAVLTMTKSIALDYVKKGIRCNCICRRGCRRRSSRATCAKLSGTRG